MLSAALGAVRAFEAAAGLMSFNKAAKNEPISTARTKLARTKLVLRFNRIVHFFVPCPALCRVSTEVARRLPQSVGGRVEPGHERKGVACV